MATSPPVCHVRDSHCAVLWHAVSCDIDTCPDVSIAVPVDGHTADISDHIPNTPIPSRRVPNTHALLRFPFADPHDPRTMDAFSPKFAGTALDPANFGDNESKVRGSCG